MLNPSPEPAETLTGEHPAETPGTAKKPQRPAPATENENGTSENVILEREGVHYIDNSVFDPNKETENNLDPEFKKLVDSVIKS
jgi:hypothetical protein